MANRETKTIDGENQFTAWVTPHGAGPHYVEIAAESDASFNGTITVQTKHPDAADAAAVDESDTYTTEFRKLVELPTELSVRVGVKTSDFSSGEITVVCGKNPDGANR